MTDMQQWFLAFIFGAVVAFIWSSLRGRGRDLDLTDGAVGVLAAMASAALAPVYTAVALGLILAGTAMVARHQR